MVENKHKNKILKAPPPNMIVGIYSFRMQKTFPFLILGVLGGYGGGYPPGLDSIPTLSKMEVFSY